VKRFSVVFLLVALATLPALAQVAAPPIVGGPGTPHYVAGFTGPKSIANTGVAEVDSCLSRSDTALLTGDPSIAALLCLRDPDPNNPEPRVAIFAGSPTEGTLVAINTSLTGSDAAGIHGSSGSADRGIGVRGTVGNPDAAGGIGVLGEAVCPNCDAGVFNSAGGGNILVGLGLGGISMFRVDGGGNVFANSYNVGGADFAESFAVAGEREGYGPGDLLVIDPAGKRRLALATEAYSTLVAGIYSTKPGIVASPYRMDDPRLAKEIPLAIVGVVPCKVSAENGAIEPGDLLVTSSTTGYAMKGTDRSRMMGAIVGKALEPLASGKGVIQVLFTLQ